MGIESSVTTTGETLVPALNIMSKESFDELLSKEYDPAFVYKIGSLEFFDEYCGDPITTVIVVLSDYGAELYRR